MCITCCLGNAYLYIVSVVTIINLFSPICFRPHPRNLGAEIMTSYPTESPSPVPITLGLQSDEAPRRSVRLMSAARRQSSMAKEGRREERVV